MITPSKKLISLFLIFSLMALSVNLYAKKQGATLIITKKDGQQIREELITVKPNSLLLLDAEGKDVSVDIADIRAVRIVKKLKYWLGAGIGGAIGGGIALYKIVSAYKAEDGDGGFISYFLLGSLVVPVALMAGAVLGAGIGALVGTDKVIYFTGMTDSEIQETLDKLRKKARIRDYK
jgi:hypothetical protein